jgi:hypothetical protein
MRLHFGLAAEKKIQAIEVCWPSGLVERFVNATVDTVITVKEGTGEAVKEPGGGLLKPNKRAKSN